MVSTSDLRSAIIMCFLSYLGLTSFNIKVYLQHRLGRIGLEEWKISSHATLNPLERESGGFSSNLPSLHSFIMIFERNFS